MLCRMAEFVFDPRFVLRAMLPCALSTTLRSLPERM